MPRSRLRNLTPHHPRRCRRALAAAALVLSAAPAAASDALFSASSLTLWEALGRRYEQPREPALTNEADALPAAYMRAGDRVSEAAIDAVPGVALASRPQAAGGAPESRAWVANHGFTSRTGADARGPALNAKGAGFTAGVDRLLDPTLLVGVAAGFSRAETWSTSVRRDLDTFSGGGYVSWAPRAGWEFDGYLGQTWVEQHSRRVLALDGTPIPTSGETRGPGFNAAASAGYRFRAPASFGETFAKPFVSLEHASQKRQAYDEAGPFATLAVPSETVERTTLNLGVAAGFDVRAGAWTLRPELRLAWSRHLSDPEPQLTAVLAGTPVLIGDPDPGRDGALVSLELTAWKQRQLQAFAGYIGEFRSNATVHQGRGGLRMAW